MPISRIFTSNMVLQQKKPLTIFGFEPYGSKVEITVENDRTLIKDAYTVYADQNGYYILNGKKYDASFDTYNITVTVNDRTEKLVNCLFGDCYLLAGQSNMAFCFKHYDDYYKYKNKVINNNAIRYIHVKDQLNNEGYVIRPENEQKDLKEYTWRTTQDEIELAETSGLGIMTAYELYTKSNIPIGFVHTAIGGTSIDTWLSKNEIYNNESILKYLIDTNKLAKEEDYSKNYLKSYTITSGIYNEKIAPLNNLALKGILWYQGEDSVREEIDAIYYKQALLALVNSYREHFNDKDLLFIAINIASHNYGYANHFAVNMINESINELIQELKYYYYISIYDYQIKWENERIGKDANPIHPTNKAFLAKRIAKIINNPNILSSVSRYEIINNKIIITYNNVGKGLKLSKGNTLRGFNIAGNDLIYHQAIAKIINKNQVEIYSPYINEPLAFTYAFYLYNYDSNLVNSYNVLLPIYRSRKDSINVANYNPNNKYLTLDCLTEYQNDFFSAFGHARMKPIFNADRIHSLNKCHLTLSNDYKTEGDYSLKISYKIGKVNNFFSISPSINKGGNFANFVNFNYISLDLYNPSNHKVNFLGAIIECQNHLYILPIVTADGVSNEIEINQSGFKTYTLFLNRIYQNDYTLIDVNKNFKSNINRIEFIFYSEESGYIYLDNIMMHVK